MEPFDDQADVFAERAIERRLERLDRGDLEPALAHRRRDLGADEAHAHHDRAAAPGDRVPNTVGVGDGAQIIDTGQIEPRDREAPVPSAGGDEHVVELEAVPAVELQRPLLDVDPYDRGPEPGLDLALAVELRRPQQRLFERHPAAQIVLRERRAIVRQLRLRAHQHHPPVEALLAQRGRRRLAGEARADDRDRRGRGHQNSTCRSFPWTRTG